MAAAQAPLAGATLSGSNDYVPELGGGLQYIETSGQVTQVPGEAPISEPPIPDVPPLFKTSSLVIQAPSGAPISEPPVKKVPP